MADSFTHLHVHTEYSMLDGAARIAEVVGAAAADGQPALGITDHGNMYGVLDFYKECRAQGIKPIIGSELYMAHESRSSARRAGAAWTTAAATPRAARSSTTTSPRWRRPTRATGTSSSCSSEAFLERVPLQAQVPAAGSGDRHRGGHEARSRMSWSAIAS